jgi:2-polyprenyl-3-methyl-5-hydroxy-6-metoxy-1,4-benzoquinol methylase
MKAKNGAEGYLVPKKIQDEEYTFPYHYISSHGKNAFRHALSFSWALNYEATIEFIIANLRQISFSTIVDIGCGDGRMTRELSVAFPRARVVGIDYSERAIQLARGMNPRIEFQCCDIVRRKKAERFDAAVLMEVLEHIAISEANEFVHAVSAHLNSSGRLYLTIPHTNCRLTPKHYQHFTETMLARYFESDFRILELCPFEVHDIRKSILDRLFTNKAFILNECHILNAVYAFYKKYLFRAKPDQNYQRLYMEAQKKG